MNKVILLTLMLILGLAFCQQPIQAQQTINQKFQAQLTTRQFDGDDEFNIPLSGNSSEQQTKSKAQAALFSLLLPGAGQYYVGNQFNARLFLGIECGMWLSYYGFHQYANYTKESARAWAILKAGADPNNTDDLYWVKMTYYDNRDRNEEAGFGYNQMIAVIDRENAVLFPETPNYYWNWDNKADRDKYRNLRNQSKTANRRAGLFLGGVVVNHVVSAVEALFAAGKYNRRLEFSGLQLYYSFRPNLHNPSLALGLTKSIN
jgi:hypothetical protein